LIAKKVHKRGVWVFAGEEGLPVTKKGRKSNEHRGGGKGRQYYERWGRGACQVQGPCEIPHRGYYSKGGKVDSKGDAVFCLEGKILFDRDGRTPAKGASYDKIFVFPREAPPTRKDRGGKPGQKVKNFQMVQRLREAASKSGGKHQSPLTGSQGKNQLAGKGKKRGPSSTFEMGKETIDGKARAPTEALQSCRYSKETLIAGDGERDERGQEGKRRGGNRYAPKKEKKKDIKRPGAARKNFPRELPLTNGGRIQINCNEKEGHYLGEKKHQVREKTVCDKGEGLLSLGMQMGDGRKTPGLGKNPKKRGPRKGKKFWRITRDTTAKWRGNQNLADVPSRKPYFCFPLREGVIPEKEKKHPYSVKKGPKVEGFSAFV